MFYNVFFISVVIVLMAVMKWNYWQKLWCTTLEIFYGSHLQYTRERFKYFANKRNIQYKFNAILEAYKEFLLFSLAWILPLVLLCHWCGILSVWHSNMSFKAWKLDIWWASGEQLDPENYQLSSPCLDIKIDLLRFRKP